MNCIEKGFDINTPEKTIVIDGNIFHIKVKFENNEQKGLDALIYSLLEKMDSEDNE